MQQRGVLINASPIVRLVTHLDVSRQQLADVVGHWQAFCSAKEPGVSQRILVLGASGYIGQHLVQALSEQGYPVLAAARHVDRLQKLNLPGVSCHPLDLNQPQAFRPAGAGGYRLLSGARDGRRRRFYCARTSGRGQRSRCPARHAGPAADFLSSCRRRKPNNRIICAPGKSPPTFCGNPPYRSPNCGRELSSAPAPPLSK